CRDKVEAAGSSVVMQAPVVRVEHADGRATAVVAAVEGGERRYPATDVISSMPIPQLLLAMDPPVDERTAAAANDLWFRDHLSVALVVPEADSFPDNWIYIHDP